ncbi:LytTR family DNA-binding domain-containing protein [Labilibaculum sp. DW002]|uniref:LytTR family DNA-binding domain-containing protein n=1 Tax=Paralabilibaculum antarcticum TaxID=2912572 RepID=A0ABT5VW44_9BACT|nr:LytTR family DNA-binding domain-containing protein [Labilibaculum sp. DW002]MDE5419646.1 LytTR family DNA-binding domain-containing protein [Labilibaculum sp. DW002]
MNKISCIAVDDEPLALGLIVSYIQKTPFLDLKNSFDNPIDAMEFLEVNPVQLLFLDIQMPDLTGVEFARILDENCKVIFTTAYDKYALDGFKLEALDYLLKPISYEIFLESANRAKKYFKQISPANTDTNIDSAENDDYLFIKADYQVKRIDYSEILYFEGLKDYVKLYTESSIKPIVFHSTMKSLEEKLPTDRFMRIHRSYLVNLDKIKTIERDRILFGKERIPISKQYKDTFDEFVKKKFL